MGSISSHQWDKHHRQLEFNSCARSRENPRKTKVANGALQHSLALWTDANFQMIWYSVDWIWGFMRATCAKSESRWSCRHFHLQKAYLMKASTCCYVQAHQLLFENGVRHLNALDPCKARMIIPFCRRVLPDLRDSWLWYGLLINWRCLHEHRTEIHSTPKTNPRKIQCWDNWEKSKRAHQNCAQKSQWFLRMINLRK